MSVRTVLGSIEVGQLKGPILPHEHILVDFSRGHVIPPNGLEWLIDARLTMANLGQIRRHPYSVRQNLIMNNEEEMKKELELFKSAGGSTVCELSCIGIRCSPHKLTSLVQLSQETGVNIVHATGYYCHRFLPDSVHKMTADQMAQSMLKEVCDGVDDSKVRCGAVYIGCSWPLHPTEENALRAAAAVQLSQGIPITIHPGRNEAAPFQILDILDSSGADTTKICITHIDRTYTCHQASRLLALASRNCYLNISLFGKECSHYQYDSSFDMPSDAQRIELLKMLMEGGHSKKVLVSHDVVCRHELRCCGGHGYTHLLEHVIPKMRERGISDESIDNFTITNPLAWLTPLSCS